MNFESVDRDRAALQRRVIRLAADRSSLFHIASTNGCLTPDEQQHLTTTERELDECFLALRSQRALTDSRRFDRENRDLWRRLGPPAPPKRARK